MILRGRMSDLDTSDEDDLFDYDSQSETEESLGSFAEFMAPTDLYVKLLERQKENPTLLKRNLSYADQPTKQARGKRHEASRENAEWLINVNIKLRVDAYNPDRYCYSHVTVFYVVGLPNATCTEIEPLEVKAVTVEVGMAKQISVPFPDVSVAREHNSTATSRAEKTNGDANCANTAQKARSPVLLFLVWEDHPDLRSICPARRSEARTFRVKSAGNDKTFSVIPPGDKVLWDCTYLPENVLESTEATKASKRGCFLELKRCKLHTVSRRDGMSCLTITQADKKREAIPFSIHCEFEVGRKKCRNTSTSQANRDNQGQASGSKESVFFHYIYGEGDKHRKVEAMDGFVCPWCEMAFVDFSSLSKHLEASHALFTFKMSQDRRKHVVSVHAPKRELFLEHPFLPADASFWYYPSTKNSVYWKGRRAAVAKANGKRPRLAMANGEGPAISSRGKGTRRQTSVAAPMKRYFCKGNVFFHSRTGIQMTQEEVEGSTDSDNETENRGDMFEWTLRRRLDGCSPSTLVEKEFMHKWNMFILMQKRAVHNSQIGENVYRFTESILDDVRREPAWEKCLLHHLLLQWDHGLLSATDCKKCVSLITSEG